MDTYQTAYAIGAIVGSIVSGAVIGLIPLILGLKKGFKGLAIGGFFACVVGSFISGLFLSVPICAVFTVIISVKAKKAAQQAAQNVSNDNDIIG